ncbi:hypothetical protein CMESO_351 (nucleomorph) [Chroomonas mesostigmatica CCMP1168]|uniref:Uncharacterized protein n=1 Tax=Chroomonas mesostigmatica CCMP1168 TaxID=1195612 RepID=J7G8A7_9CRYP|nr:hypothetical protein CMESO_351 [Chroomonas mesostigmatica CCMP1168]
MFYKIFSKKRKKLHFKKNHFVFFLFNFNLRADPDLLFIEINSFLIFHLIMRLRFSINFKKKMILDSENRVLKRFYSSSLFWRKIKIFHFYFKEKVSLNDLNKKIKNNYPSNLFINSITFSNKFLRRKKKRVNSYCSVFDKKIRLLEKLTNENSQKSKLDSLISLRLNTFFKNNLKYVIFSIKTNTYFSKNKKKNLFVFLKYFNCFENKLLKDKKKEIQRKIKKYNQNEHFFLMHKKIEILFKKWEHFFVSSIFLNFIFFNSILITKIVRIYQFQPKKVGKTKKFLKKGYTFFWLLNMEKIKKKKKLKKKNILT